MMMIIPENREIDSFDDPVMLALVLVFGDRYVCVYIMCV
jgi:hypothetical protein